MKLQKKMTVMVLATALIFFFLNEVMHFFVTLEHQKNSVYEKNKNAYNAIMNSQYESLKGIGMLLSLDDDVKKAYMLNKPDLIKKRVGKLWEKIKKEKLLDELHFFDKKSNSFLDLSGHKRETNDSYTRCDISWTINNLQKSSHALVCTQYAGIRSTYPIYSTKNELLGALSVGKKISTLPIRMQSITGQNSFLIYSKKAAKSLTKSYYKDFLKDKKVVGEYIVAEHTLQPDFDTVSKINFLKSIQKVEINKKEYFLNIIPIKDFNDRDIAYLCMLNDTEKLYTGFYYNMLKNLLLIIVVYFLLYIILRNKISGILGEVKKIKAVSDSLAAKKFDILDTFDSQNTSSSHDEIEVLSHHIIEMGRILKFQTKSLEEKVILAEEKAALSNKIMIHQSKLAAMGEMVDAIAHQWKQPINILSMRIELLELDFNGGVVNPEYITDYKNVSLKQIAHMVNTLNEFRGFLRPDKKSSLFSLIKPLESVQILLKDELMKYKIEIEINCADNLTVFAIENEFKHVIINLINNSKDEFCQKNIQGRRIVIEAEQKDNRTVIQIIDNAGGIPDSIIDKIFDTNFTTKESKEGSGMGLYISKLIMEKNGGIIKVENSNKGACFTLSLPNSLDN